MLADPVTVAAASPTPEVKFSLIQQDGLGSQRIDTNGGGYTAVINHSKGKNGNRHYVQVTQEVVATDPFTGLPRKYTASASFSISRPPGGFTDAAIVALAKLLSDFRDDAEVTTARLIQFQS